MAERQLIIGRQLLQRMLEHCLEEKPLEACGILAGRDGRVATAFATDNSRRSPIAFEVDPDQQEIALRLTEERQQELLGIYHSHPTAPAVPSAADIDQAVHYPEAIRLIISLHGPTELGAFLIRDRKVEQVQLVVLDSSEGEYCDLRAR